MLASERRGLIVSTINTKGHVTVEELATRFGVTSDCIRKDLRFLDAKGLCHRVYGGAVSMMQGQQDTRAILSRIDVRADEKRAIAVKAVNLIKPNSLVFLDVSTTNLYLAETLVASRIRLTVVSNMLDILSTMASCPTITAIGTPGVVNDELNGLFGTSTIAYLTPFKFDAAFIGARAVSIESGSVSTFEMDDGLVKQTVIERAFESYLMADNHKFSLESNYSFAQISQFTGIVCEKRPEEEKARAIESLGVRLI